MRKYETVYIADPEKTEEQVVELTESIKAFLEKEGGTVEQVEPWGKKKLAYTVKKRKYGHFTLLLHTAPSDIVVKLERFLKFNESVIKYQTLIHDERSALRPSMADPASSHYGRDSRYQR
ncbi:MAG: 30S ribosomal protein S6 [Nitrospinota bacterium]